jgi:hypothetical protein
MLPSTCKYSHLTGFDPAFHGSEHHSPHPIFERCRSMLIALPSRFGCPDTMHIHQRTRNTSCTGAESHENLCGQPVNVHSMQAAGDASLPAPERVLIQALLHNGHPPFADMSAAMLVADLEDQPHSLLSKEQLHALYLADLCPEPPPVSGCLKPSAAVTLLPLTSGERPLVEFARAIARGAPNSLHRAFQGTSKPAELPRLPLQQPTLRSSAAGEAGVYIPEREIETLRTLLEEAQVRALTLGSVTLWCVHNADMMYCSSDCTSTSCVPLPSLGMPCVGYIQ